MEELKFLPKKVFGKTPFYPKCTQSEQFVKTLRRKVALTLDDVRNLENQGYEITLVAPRLEDIKV